MLEVLVNILNSLLYPFDHQLFETGLRRNITTVHPCRLVQKELFGLSYTFCCQFNSLSFRVLTGGNRFK